MGQVLPALRLRCLLRVEIAVRGAVLDAVLDAMPGFVRGAVRRAVRYSVRCKGASGWAAALHCGGLRFAATSLRCSGPGGERRTRPYARCAVNGAQTTSLDRVCGAATPEPLRSSAPHKCAATHPPATLQDTSVPCEEERNALRFLSAQAKTQASPAKPRAGCGLRAAAAPSSAVEAVGALARRPRISEARTRAELARASRDKHAAPADCRITDCIKYLDDHGHATFP